MSRRKRKPRKSRKRLAYGVIAVIFILVCVGTYFYLNPSNQTPTNGNPPNQLPPETAIVDHLSFKNETANQTFVDTSKNVLENADFSVDYYGGNEINITFYINLLTHDYSLIVFRVHSAMIENLDSLCLFTSEPYDPNNIPPAYYDDIINNRTVQAYFTEGDPIHYFAIAPSFVEKYGNFQNTTIILMGCDGLKNNKMAEAFIKKGARVCIGWDRLVNAPHTDHATAHLLQHLTQGNTVEEAVDKTMDEVGPDKMHNSILKYYPSAAGNYTIQIMLSISSMNTVKANTVLTIEEKKGTRLSWL